MDKQLQIPRWLLVTIGSVFVTVFFAVLIAGMLWLLLLLVDGIKGLT